MDIFTDLKTTIMKRFIILFVFLIDCVSLAMSQNQTDETYYYDMYDFVVDNIAYKIVSDNCVYVAAPIGPVRLCDFPNMEWYYPVTYTDLSGDLEINSSVEYGGKTYTVTGVHDYAFMGCALTNVVFPSTITTIGHHAFYKCSKLQGLTLPQNLKEIGDSAFRNCYLITDVAIPNSVKTVGRAAFHNCIEMKTLSVGTGVEFFGGYCFENCSSLKSVYWAAHSCVIEFPMFHNAILPDFTFAEGVIHIPNDLLTRQHKIETISLPNSVESIGDRAFFQCTSLKNIVVGNKLRSIGSQAFYNCSALEDFELPEGLQEIAPSAFLSCKSFKSVRIPSSVESIGASAFYNCSNLESAIIGDKVSQVQDRVFGACSNLKTVYIGKSVVEFGVDVFSGCYKIEEVKWMPKKINTRGVNLFSGAKYKSIVFADDIEELPDYICNNQSLLNEITIPATVTSIGDYAFQGCTKLKAIDLPARVKNIGIAAFANTNISSISIPSGVSVINKETFKNCTALTAISVPYRVTLIDESAFWGCTGLTEVSLGKAVAEIGQDAFNGCAALKKVYSKNTTPPKMTNQETFANKVYSNATLYVPLECYSKYNTTMYWNYFENIEETEFSGIEDIITDEPVNGPSPVFTVSGQYLGVKKRSDLPAGIYIINGKKVIVN